MTTGEACVAEKIAVIAKELRALKPFYADTIAFYSALFTMQEERIARIVLPDVDVVIGRPTGEVAGPPLLDHTRFAVDYDSAGELLPRICRLTAERGGGDAAVAGRSMLEALNAGRIDVRTLGECFLAGVEDRQLNLASELGLAAEYLFFVTYHCLRPSLVVAAKRIAARHEGLNSSNEGHCPICGSSPAMASLGKQGEKSLVCGFCWHTWRVPRLFCPFCGNQEGKTLGYLAIEGEDEYRIDTCDRCKSYWKTVVATKLARDIYPPLEFELTRHLDLKAQERGYGADAAPAGNA